MPEQVLFWVSMLLALVLGVFVEDRRVAIAFLWIAVALLGYAVFGAAVK